MSTKFNELMASVKIAALGVPQPAALGAPVNPAAQGADQPIPLPPSSGGIGSAPAPAVAQPPSNMPPAAIGGGTAPPASQQAQIDAEAARVDQEVATKELEAKKIDAQAKSVGADAKIETSRMKLVQNQAKLQEAQVKAQQLQGATGAPAGAPTVGVAQSSVFQDLMSQVTQKAGSGRRPSTLGEIKVKVALSSAKCRKYASTRSTMSDSSALAEVLLRDIPADQVKQGFELDPLTDTDPRLIAFALQTGGCGRMLDMINQRQHKRARVEKVAAGDMDAYRDVLRRGVALHQAIVKMSHALFREVEKAQDISKLNAVDFVVKLAAGHTLPKQFTVRQALSVMHDRKLRKRAVVRDLPRMTISDAVDTIGKTLAITSKMANDELSCKAIRRILVDQPELRKVANISVFDTAGAAALVNNDTDTLAKCVLGLALESRLGSKAYEIATT